MSGDAASETDENNTPYFTLSGDEATGTAKVSYADGKAYVQDENAKKTVNFIIPFDEITSGKVTVSADVLLTSASNKWTVMQLHGKKSDGTAGEILGIRTVDGKYGYRVNAGAEAASTITAFEKVNKTNTFYEANVVFEIDVDNKNAKITITDKATGTAFVKEGLTLDVSALSQLRFVTATAERSIYVDNVKIIEN
ncbi:MAG: hypothetical protein IJ736_05520 [Firmicutes bacterium]|nr:hypothetical protein [Bacillota bacterium]